MARTWKRVRIAETGIKVRDTIQPNDSAIQFFREWGANAPVFASVDARRANNTRFNKYFATLTMPVLNRLGKRSREGRRTADSFPAMCHVQLHQLLAGVYSSHAVCLSLYFQDLLKTRLRILYTLRLQRQVRYCDILYAHSNTMRDTKHRGFGFNCATRSNTRV